MNPGFPRPLPAGENALRGAFSATPPAVPDHTLVQIIDGGSYGEVWLGRNVMGTARAIKVVYRGVFKDERPYEREFMGIQRSEPVSRTHEGLVDILQVGRNDEAGYFYYVMELADEAKGEWPAQRAGADPHSPIQLRKSDFYRPRTLAYEIVARKRLPVEECISLALSLTGAVAHLHKHGLIHRDIKPSNIIFVDGLPKLADIGLVSEAGDSRSYVGTEGYIPPEGPGTQQADLYSLGKLVYEAVTGNDRTAFPALPIELTRGEDGPRFLELNAIFLKACAHDARQRYQSAEEMQADLALLQSGKSIRRLRTIERRLAFMSRVGAAALLLAALAFSAYGFAKRQARLDRENFLRLEHAEKEARTQLRQALFSQAQALRRSGQSGQRFESLAALAKAANLDASSESAAFGGRGQAKRDSPSPLEASPSDQAKSPSPLRATSTLPGEAAVGPLANASRILELRNEAIASLMLADLRLVQPRFLNGRATVSVDSAFERYASGAESGRVRVCALSDDGLLAN